MLKFDWSGIQVGYKWVKESTKNGLPHRPMLHIHKHLSVYREHLIILIILCHIVTYYWYVIQIAAYYITSLEI